MNIYLLIIKDIFLRNKGYFFLCTKKTVDIFLLCLFQINKVHSIINNIKCDLIVKPH